MKILMLNANRAGIGTYHRALNFGRVLCKAGHEVTLVTVSNTEKWRAREKLDTSGLRIIEGPQFLDEILPWHSSGVLDIALRCREVLAGKYDVVYAFEYQPNVSLPALIAKYFKGLPLISDWCDWHAGVSYHFGGYRWAHAIDRVFEEFIRHRANYVTVINQTLYDRALSIGVPKHKLALIREGVDPAYIRPLDRAEARSRLGLPEDACIVGTIHDAVDGMQLLVRSIRLLLDRHDLPRVPHLLIVGRTPPSIAEYAAQMGIADNILLPGRVSDEDLPYYLACCDVLTLPLEDNRMNRGRWPHKLGDLAAAKRPLVISMGGEFPALLQQKGAAVVCPREADAYAGAFADILAFPQRYQDIAKNARALMAEELSWGVLAGQILRVVEQAARAR